MTIVKTALDYDYEIVKAHERLNRLLPVRNASDEDMIEIAELYKHINALVESKKANSSWEFPDYAELIRLSKDGRERIGVYPYPVNEHDWRYLHTYITKHMQFFKALSKIETAILKANNGYFPE